MIVMVISGQLLIVVDIYGTKTWTGVWWAGSARNDRNEEEPFPFCRCDDSNILLAFVYKLSIDKIFSYLSKLI
jgi:hypothetical protein